jgi:hypothetical protein
MHLETNVGAFASRSSVATDAPVQLLKRAWLSERLLVLAASLLPRPCGCGYVAALFIFLPFLVDVVMWLHRLSFILSLWMWICGCIVYVSSFPCGCGHVAASFIFHPFLVDVGMWLHRLFFILSLVSSGLLSRALCSNAWLSGFPELYLNSLNVLAVLQKLLFSMSMHVGNHTRHLVTAVGLPVQNFVFVCEASILANLSEFATALSGITVKGCWLLAESLSFLTLCFIGKLIMPPLCVHHAVNHY